MCARAHEHAAFDACRQENGTKPHKKCMRGHFRTSATHMFSCFYTDACLAPHAGRIVVWRESYPCGPTGTYGCATQIHGLIRMFAQTRLDWSWFGPSVETLEMTNWDPLAPEKKILLHFCARTGQANVVGVNNFTCYFVRDFTRCLDMRVLPERPCSHRHACGADVESSIIWPQQVFPVIVCVC